MIPKMKLLIFDVDGTLTKPFRTELLPGITSWFASMRRELIEPPILAIATNQGGVAYRHYLLETAPERAWKYADQPETERRINIIANNLDITHIYISFAYRFPNGQWVETPINAAGDPRWSRNWRKPNPGMLQQVLADVNLLPDEALMVGNEETDRKAAISAGIQFAFAHDFFSQLVFAI